MKGFHIVLDVDGTLIDEDSLAIRPYLKEFFDFCFNHFDSVNVWTAMGSERYSLVHQRCFEKLLGDKSFGFVYTAERCSRGRANLEMDQVVRPVVKRLRKVWRKKSNGLTKHNTIIVDDTKSTYQENRGNGVPIRTFTAGASDDYLMKLLEWLPQLINQDLRRFPKENWYSQLILPQE